MDQDKPEKAIKPVQGNRNLKQILIFTGLSVISIALVLIFTINEKTIKAIEDVQPLFLLFTALVWFCSICGDSFGMVFFVRGTGEKIKIFEAFKLSLIRIFFNVITPFSAGGQPVTIFCLTKAGVSAGKSSSIIITRLISLTLCSFIGAIYSFFFFGREISTIPALSWAFLLTAGLVVVFIVVGVLGLLYPRFLLFIINLAGGLLSRLRIVKDLTAFKRAAIRQVVNARSSFKNYFSKHPGSLACGMLGNAVMYVAQVSTLYCILLGLGISISYARGFASCALLIFLLSFMPTPGASGLGDLIFIVIFTGSGNVPKYLLGIAIVLWRTFYQYLSAILGAIFSARFFSAIMVKKTPKTAPVSGGE